MSAADETRNLWTVSGFCCLMISCCAGAELQVRRADGSEEIVLRELYPTKSDLYERARSLQAEYAVVVTNASEPASDGSAY